MIKIIGESQLEYTPYTFEELKQKKEAKHRVIGRVIKCTADDVLLVELGDNLIGELSLEYFADTIKPVTKVALVDKIGKVVEALIDSIDSSKIVLNRAALQKEYKEEIIRKTMKPGIVFTTNVASIASFGVFVEMGCGVVALLQTNDIAKTIITNVQDIFKPGQEITVIFKAEIDGQYLVSHKELLGTWLENVEDFKPGDTVHGIVHEIKEGNAYITLTPNLAGIVDIPGFDLTVGDNVLVTIKSISDEKMRVKLHKVGKTEVPFRYVMKYKIKEDRLKEWVYSPSNCEKVVTTVFF